MFPPIISDNDGSSDGRLDFYVEPSRGFERLIEGHYDGIVRLMHEHACFVNAYYRPFVGCFRLQQHDDGIARFMCETSVFC